MPNETAESVSFTDIEPANGDKAVTVYTGEFTDASKKMAVENIKGETIPGWLQNEAQEAPETNKGALMSPVITTFAHLDQEWPPISKLPQLSMESSRWGSSEIQTLQNPRRNLVVPYTL